MYTVEILLKSPAGNPVSRMVSVKCASDDDTKIIDLAHDKIKNLLKKGYQIQGGNIQ